MKVSEVISIVTRVRARMRMGGPCAIMDFLEASLEEADSLRVEQALVHHTEWAPAYSAAGVIECAGDGVRQAVYAESFSQWPFAQARPYVERLLSKHGECLEVEALAALEAIVDDAHPNPKALFLTPAVAAKMRHDVDIQRKRAPDFDPMLDIISNYGAVCAASREREAAAKSAKEQKPR